jgi:hypothetical protein
MRQPSSVARHIDEQHWPWLVPVAERSSEWLSAAAKDLERAARAWETPFVVEYDGIREKLEEAVVLAVFGSRDALLAFVSASEPKVLPRTGLRARYINGAIAHPSEGPRGQFDRLMAEIGNGCDLEVLHTQSIYMMRAIENRSRAIFPAPQHDRVLADALTLDLAEWMSEIRDDKSAAFSPRTGVIDELYDDCLYQSWPIPGNEAVASFRSLPTNRSGVLVVGFVSEVAATRWLINRGMGNPK